MFTLIDTPIFIASFAEIDHRKKGIGHDTIRRALGSDQFVTCDQVVTEFITHARQSFDRPMQAGQLHEYLRVVLEPLRRPTSSIDLLHEAIDLAERWHLRLADARILAAATELGCSRILSDRPYSGRSYGPIEVVNPFM